jgi:stearoyl-CoA desaturase (Delta-9 desaturase)
MANCEADKMEIQDAPELHISETPITLTNWYKHVDWESTFWVVGLPVLGLVAAAFTPLQTNTALWAVIYHVTTGIGITAGAFSKSWFIRDPTDTNDVGYHRLWAHRSYDASLALKIWLAAFGGGAIEDSIRTWSRDHRAHHRYTDTVKDPYSVRKGLLYAHIGWLVLKQNPKHLGHADVSDLDKDPVVIWQHRYYIPVALVMGFILPSCVAGLGWGDWEGGLVYAGVLRTFTVQQSTFCVNSVAHWLGDQTFDDRNSPRDHMITALITAGEGYHNFHHEFPSDYRNAIAWYQFDPTKWAIWLWKQFGLAYNLKRFRQNEIEKGRLQQEQRKLDQKSAQFHWTLEQLPLMEWEDYLETVAQGHSLIVIAGVVHDVGNFVSEHPGGQMFIESGIGKDATATFNGGIHNREILLLL